MSVFVDSGVFIAYVNKKDANHKNAVVLLENIMKNKHGVPYTSDYIFDEVVTVALYKTRKLQKAIDASELIIGNEEKKIPRFLNFLPVTTNIFNNAWKLFRRYAEKRLSFTDCTSISFINRRGIDYIASFDDDFDGIVVRISE